MTTPSGTRAVEPVDRAHLTGAGRPSPPIHRCTSSVDPEPLVQRYGVPVWSLRSPQRPVDVAPHVPGGVPGGGQQHLRPPPRDRPRPVHGLARRDRLVDVADVPQPDVGGLARSVRALVADDPTRPAAHRPAIAEPGAAPAQIVADLGYTDQTHSTADFRAVTGTTPGRFLDDQRPPGKP